MTLSRVAALFGPWLCGHCSSRILSKTHPPPPPPPAFTHQSIILYLHTAKTILYILRTCNRIYYLNLDRGGEKNPWKKKKPEGKQQTRGPWSLQSPVAAHWLHFHSVLLALLSAGATDAGTAVRLSDCSRRHWQLSTCCIWTWLLINLIWTFSGLAYATVNKVFFLFCKALSFLVPMFALLSASCLI